MRPLVVLQALSLALALAAAGLSFKFQGPFTDVFRLAMILAAGLVVVHHANGG